MDFEKISARLLDEFQSLRKESSIIHGELVKPSWGSVDRHGFPHTLYGLVMNSMALLDRLSCYVAGSLTKKQQTRMRRTLELTGADRECAAVAVQLWRNGLMHTGGPLEVNDPAKGVTYLWLLHWGDELPRDQHMTVIVRSPKERILGLALLYLVEDLEALAVSLFSQWREDADKQAVVETVHAALAAGQQVQA